MFSDCCIAISSKLKHSLLQSGRIFTRLVKLIKLIRLRKLRKIPRFTRPLPKVITALNKS